MALSQGRARGPHRLAVPLPRSRARVRHLLVSISHSRTLCRRGEAIQTSDPKIRSLMNTPERFAELVQTFFCDYLIKQRDLSPRTVSAYRDTQSEMQAILEAMDNSWSGRRDHLLFLFLYNTGARVSEALGVRVQDVQRNDYRAVQLL